MAVENLAEEVEKVEKQKKQRYPLADIKNNREEIRLISEKTIDYCKTLYPELEGLKVWEIIPTLTMIFFDEYFKLADSKKSKTENITLHVANFMEITVEYGETPGADKEGTFNPKISLGSELLYDNDNPKNNNLKKEQIVIPLEDQDQLDLVCQRARNQAQNYGVYIQDPDNIWQIVLCYVRQIRQYLIEHKDDADYTDINLGTKLDIGISRVDKNDLSFYNITPSTPWDEIGVSNSDNVDYHIQFAPGQSFKMDNAKSDDTTEKQ